MSRHLTKGSEMNVGKIKMGSLIGALIFCASAQVAAQICEAERRGVISASKENKNPYMGRYSDEDLSTPNMIATVTMEVGDGGDFRYMAGECGPRCYKFSQNNRGVKSDSPDYHEALLVWADVQDLRIKKMVGRGPLDFAYYQFRGCIARHMAVKLNATPGNTASSPGRPSATSPVSQSTPNAPSTSSASPEAARLTREAREATTRAQQSQARVDQARRGKPKRHVQEAEAHQCLRLITDPGSFGGFINGCPYMVEYTYCAYRPKKDSWAEAFDCEKQKMGSWHISANRRDGAHTKNAEMIYWFACKYGERIGKPDGVSPADIEFVPGRGLVGRCAEWGAG